MSVDLTSGVEETRPNAVACGLRTGRGWSQRRLALEFQTIGRRLDLPVPANIETLIKQIRRIELGHTQIPDEMYQRLWSVAFGVPEAELFGQLDGGDLDAATFTVTSHKFVPAFLTEDAVASLRAHDGWVPADGQWWPGCQRYTLSGDSSAAGLYLWPWNVAIIHLSEELELSSIAELAVWRRATYPATRAWADSQLLAMTGDPMATTSYVLSAYWVDRPKWGGEQLDRAMRLLSMPSVLLNREDEHADDAALTSGGEMVERTLLREGGIERPDLMGFGVAGVSAAYASWSSVAYFPIAPRRALPAAELVACELLVQAMWCYTGAILGQIEKGDDPVVPTDFGWRFLRAMRARLTAARPLETGQAHSMREAVLATSDLTRQLDAAMNALRETGG